MASRSLHVQPVSLLQVFCCKGYSNTLQCSASTAYFTDSTLTRIAAFAVGWHLHENSNKQKLLALHKQVYQSVLRNAAEEALLERLQSLYWDYALKGHL